MFTSIPPQNFRIHFPHNDDGNAVKIKIWFPKQQRLDIYINGQFMEPNNRNFSAEGYKLNPPDDSYIPLLTEPNGANYFDPGTGHLHLLVKGPDVISIKTQPVVVLKLGMTVDIENFFEENVVGNLAGLLGIDPANIRVTNIVREGSVGRKKRSTGETVTGVEFEIGPPPSDTLGDDFIPPEPEFSYQAEETTESPTSTTTTVATPTDQPSSTLSFNDLSDISATLANAFQTGTLAAGMNLNLTDVAMEQPLEPPAEPEYIPPEQRNEVTDTPLFEVMLEEDMKVLESTAARSLEVPTAIGVSIQPDEVFEMQQMVKYVPSVYLADSEGKKIGLVGNPSDPWMAQVSLASGPGGDLKGNTTAPFIDGVARFNEIAITEEGEDYIIEFELIYPENTNLSSIKTIPFNVGPRPLGLKFEDEPALRKENYLTFDVSVYIWDVAVNDVAMSSVLAETSWDCTLSLSGDGDLLGNVNYTLNPGNFIILIVSIDIAAFQGKQKLPLMILS